MTLRFAVSWALATTLLVAVAVGIAQRTRPPAASGVNELRFTIDQPSDERWTSQNGTGVAISPDGQSAAFLAADGEGTRRLYLRPMNELESRRVPDSDGAYHPFFSPDSRQLGFFASDRLWRVPVAGGRPIEVGPVDSTARGAAWTPDGYIYFGGSAGISRIAVSEGSPELLTSVDQDGGVGGHRWPAALPGGRALLFTIFRGGLESNRVALLSLETNEWRVLIEETGHYARYAPTDHIVYMRGDVMMAAPFDLDRLDLTGPPEPVRDGIAVNDGGAAHFDFSEDGALVWVPGGPPGRFRFRSSLVWVDRQGREEDLTLPDGAYLNPVISHGGERVAFDLFDERGNSDVAILDLERDTLTRLISDPAADAYAVWTPDDARIIFNSHRDGRVRTLFSKRSDGVGSAEPLLRESPFPAPTAASSRGQVPMAMSADGTTLLFAETNTRDFAIHALSIATGASELLLTRAFWTRISPDGKWVAYELEESGGSEIYVSPFPDVEAGRWKVSTAGGSRPVWSRDGAELFYRETTQMMAVPIQTGETFEAGIPQALFSFTSFPGFRSFDVSADGRFLMLKLVDFSDADGTEQQIHVVTNWFEQLRALGPVQ